MKPVTKTILWVLVVAVIGGGLAYPKIKPLLIAAESKSADAKPASGSSGQGEGKGEGKQGGGKRNGGGSGGGAPLKVSTFVVTPGPFAETVTSTGSLRAEEGVELQAETNGKVVAINFTEGTNVRKGALLVKLNDADLRASLARATYRRELAKTRERRYGQLLGQKVVTQDDYDSALNDVNVQQAEMALYQAQIAETEIRAPFDGVVGLRYVSMGAFVNATTRIATLQRLEKLKIDFAVPEKYTGRVTVGSTITFTVAGGAEKFTGQIFAIDPRIDSGTRTLLIRAVSDNHDGRLLPGAFANIEFTLSELKEALLIPSEAVVPGLDEKNVFVMSDGKAERRVVAIGTRTASAVHILSGLTPGEIVITSGLQQMRAGQAVTQLEPVGTKEPGAKQPEDAAGAPESKATTRVTSTIPPALADITQPTSLSPGHPPRPPGNPP